MVDSDLSPSHRPSVIRSAAHLQEALQELVRVLQSRDRALASHHGLSVSQAHALMALNGSGPMTVTTLGEQLHLEKSTASRLAKGLLVRGLVRKRSPASDDRKVILQLTEQGIRLSRKVLNDLSDECVRLLESMNPEEREGIPGILGRLSRELVAGYSSSEPSAS